MNLAVSYCIPNASYCTVCDVIVAAVTEKKKKKRLVRYDIDTICNVAVTGYEDTRM